jgi:hypothetical protein
MKAMRFALVHLPGVVSKGGRQVTLRMTRLGYTLVAALRREMVALAAAPHG